MAYKYCFLNDFIQKSHYVYVEYFGVVCSYYLQYQGIPYQLKLNKSYDGKVAFQMGQIIDPDGKITK